MGSVKPFWAFFLPDRDAAERVLMQAPDGSHIEETENCWILWVPIPDDVVEAELDA